MKPRLIPMILGLCLLLLAGCKTELYSNLSEQEVNEMLGALLERGVSADKAGDGEFFTISVPTEDVAMALATLDGLGLPRGSRESMGQVFAKSGIVSSPFEERIRYIYALGEEVSQTLMEIDGVLVARVHIVMPEDPELGQTAKPSSAAVFIKQRLGFDLDFLVPQIRRLVANSIEGMQYEAVTVVLVEAQSDQMPTRPDTAEMSELLPGLEVATASMSMVWMVAAAAAGTLLMLLFSVGYLLFRTSRLKVELNAAAEEGV